MSLQPVYLKKVFSFSFCIFLTAFLFVMPATFASSNSISFSPPVNLSNDIYNARYPMVANSGSSVYVVWTEQSHGIYYRHSPDGGVTWLPNLTQPAIRLSSHGGTSGYPVITANGTDVYVAWAQTIHSISQIYFVASTDSGTAFSTPEILDLNSTLPAITPVIAGWGTSVYVAWVAGTKSYERSSTDSGVSWSSVNNLGSSHEPQLATSGNYAYFVSDGNSYAYTSDGGSTWQSVNLEIRARCGTLDCGFRAQCLRSLGAKALEQDGAHLRGYQY